MTDLAELKSKLAGTIEEIEDLLFETRNEHIGVPRFEGAGDITDLDKSMLLSAKVFLGAVRTFRAERERLKAIHEVERDEEERQAPADWNDEHRTY